MKRIYIQLLFVIFPIYSVDLEIPRFVKPEVSKDLKAYGTIEFGDSKQFIQSKLNENDIYRNNDNGAYIINLFDTPFKITFIYGSNEIKPTFLKTIRLSLLSIVDSHISTSIISSFTKQYGDAEKFYISSNEDDIKEYYRWTNDDKHIHLDFDGLNLQITIESRHFNNLSKESVKKSNKDFNKRKEDRHNNQMKKLF